MGIQARLRRDRRRVAVAPCGRPTRGAIVLRVEIFGLAGDAEGIEEAAFDAERCAECRLGACGDPSPDHRSPFGDQPGLAVVLLAVEVGLGASLLQAELLAQVRHGSGAREMGQSAPCPDDQGPSVERRSDHDC